MITFLSSPKAFTAHAGRIQMNAIRSWLAVCPDVEVIIYGNGEGVAEACHETGARHAPDTPCSPSGVPYFNGIVEHAAKYGKYDIQVYVNGDILLSGILAPLELIKFPNFLLIGQRIDLDESVFVDIAAPDLITILKRMNNEGRIRLHTPTGIDYFAFRRGLWNGLPPVIIGRAGYDNALLAYCMRNRVPIVDGTFAIIALHQFHDYGHVRGGKTTVMRGTDALVNFKAAGGKRSATLVSDADYVIRNGEIHHQPCRGDFIRCFELKCRYERGYSTLALSIRALWRMLALFSLVGKSDVNLHAVLPQSRDALKTAEQARPKVAYFTQYIPHHRHGVFELLGSRQDMDFTFAAADETLDKTIYSPQKRPFRFRSISYAHIFLPNKKNMITFSRHVLGAMMKKEFDVMILSNDILGIDVWIFALLKRFFGVRLVLWGQGISRPETPLRIRLRKWLMTLADACIFYGDDGRSTWIARGLKQDKLFVAYNALDTDLQVHYRKTQGLQDLETFRARTGLSNKKIIVFSGRLILEKRPDFVIRVMEKVVKIVPNAHFVLIGDGTDRQKLIDLMERLKLKEHCTLTGAIYDEEILSRYFLVSRAAIMPAFAGLAIQHAFAYGVPIILGDVKDSHGPEAKLVIDGETGIYCPDGDIDAFAAAIVELLNNDTLRRRLSDNALAVIETKYNKQNMAEGVVQAVRYALGN